MEKTKFKQTFTFICTEDNDTVNVFIPQIVDPQYGMYVWPAAPVLAQYIWHHRNRLPGSKVLELGSGTSLPGVLAAKLGAEVTLTDTALVPECLENCKTTCIANKINNARICALTWGEFTPELIEMKPDYIIASDCFYDTKDFENIIITASYLLRKNTAAEFWTTYQVRSSDRTIESLLQKWKLKSRRIPVSTFNADSQSLAGTDLPGNHAIQMFVITVNTLV